LILVGYYHATKRQLRPHDATLKMNIQGNDEA